ncbi:hypothetical protein D9M72_591000 [compost metagenome]
MRRSVAGDRLNRFCSTCGMIRKNHSSTITSGMERKMVTYPCANQFSSLNDDSRIIARMVPQTMPTTTAVTVILSETIMPSPRT